MMQFSNGIPMSLKHHLQTTNPKEETKENSVLTPPLENENDHHDKVLTPFVYL
jgi:hypothetical protein